MKKTESFHYCANPKCGKQITVRYGKLGQKGEFCFSCSEDNEPVDKNARRTKRTGV